MVPSIGRISLCIFPLRASRLLAAPRRGGRIRRAEVVTQESEQPLVDCNLTSQSFYSLTLPQISPLRLAGRQDFSCGNTPTNVPKLGRQDLFIFSIVAIQCRA